MKNIQTWLDEYGVSHQNPLNKTIHWICVPVIFCSIMGLLYGIKLPVQLTETLQLNVAFIMLLIVTIYYFTLSKTLWVGMFIFSLLCAVVCYIIDNSGIALWQVSLGAFVVAWIFQFYGHKVEGAKPSFIEDIQFLMIGPAWLMSFIYKKLGISY